ncbi:ATP synthase subunit I [Candidatus Magnetominusculus dajiuhuensis]|uniref:ATP synthase subunit I n=1 Tax=Candidatus Magnetominusculus dajiuhuensis TaxID=3137712 RepID=UPI003B438025
MIRNVTIVTLVVLVAVVLIALVAGYGNLSRSILLGGIVGLLNFVFLSKSITSLLNTDNVAPVMLIFNMVRLIVVMGALFVLIYLKLAEIIGLSIGLTVSFLVVMVTGYSGSGKKS